jgi:DNA processing protein
VSGVCEECAPRGLLLERLAANIDVAVDRRRGSRALDMLALDNDELAAAVTPDAARASEALAWAAAPEAFRALGRRLETTGCWMTCRHSSGWPGEFERLGSAAPWALYGRGEQGTLLGRHDPVTVVGARRASAYGREVAEGLGFGLSSAGALVVSGLALGIDSAAHEGCVKAGGPGLAVLAASPDRAYPQRASRLYRDLVGAGGAVVAELPPGAALRRWMFPSRNRVMAALGELTVVVEAAERSGSLITTEMAADCGRLVAAVPGPVNSWRSSGTNMLIVDGAVPVRDAADVLDHLHGALPAGSVGRVPRGPALEAQDRLALDAVERGADSADAVAAGAGLTGAEAAGALSRLELAGYVAVDFAGRCSRTTLMQPQGTRAP